MAIANLVIAPEVWDDLNEAYGWYEQRRAGLGEEFFSSVEACIAFIRRNPELHARVHEDYRRAMVRRFPYVVFYEYAEPTVTVYGVLHTARDPNKWRERLA
jgi:toxin ParE1/3/4